MVENILKNDKFYEVKMEIKIINMIFKVFKLESENRLEELQTVCLILITISNSLSELDFKNNINIVFSTFNYVGFSFENIINDLKYHEYANSSFETNTDSIIYALKKNLCELNKKIFDKEFFEKNQRSKREEFCEKVVKTLKKNIIEPLAEQSDETAKTSADAEPGDSVDLESLPDLFRGLLQKSKLDFFLNGLQMILFNSSVTFLDAFDEETGKPHHYKIVKKWPCLSYLPSDIRIFFFRKLLQNICVLFVSHYQRWLEIKFRSLVLTLDIF